MRGYDASTYGDRIAEAYDGFHRPDLGPVAPVVERLARLAGDGPVLELGIGTGRLAVPLAQRGVPVKGIDASGAMVAKLRERPGGRDIPVTLGDFADVAVQGQFSLVFVAFNTFFALLTSEDQKRCFRNVAARLAGGGVFVIEAFVPDISRFDRGQRVSANSVEVDEVRLDVSRHDAVNQRVDTQHVLLSEAGVRLYPVALRYAWPAELDLMAEMAGLRLQHRWGGWCEEPFTADSGTHVSVYEAA